jgi:hypothetical protein
MESPASYFSSHIAYDEIIQSDSSPAESGDEIVKVDQSQSKVLDGEGAAPANNAAPPPSELPYNYTRIGGLGSLHVFADWMILKILRLLDAEDLVQLSMVSRAFYIYSDENDIWKDLCIRKHGGNFRYFNKR